MFSTFVGLGRFIICQRPDSTKLIGDSIDLFIIMSRMATKIEDNTDANEVQKNGDSYADKQ